MTACQVSVAHHEAGHVVAAWRVGAEVESVAASAAGGLVIVRGPSGLPGREFVRRRLLVLFSGPEAERQRYPLTDTSAVGAIDYAQAVDLLTIAYGAGSPVIPLMMQVARARARAFVRRERLLIGAVAGALALRHRLDAAAIADIVRSTDPHSSLAAGFPA